MAWRQAHVRAFRECGRLALERRGSCLTGVHAAASLLKADVGANYTFRAPSHTQVPLVAELLDEPSEEQYLDMLEVLDEKEATFYRDESNVVDMSTFSQTIFDDLTRTYVFVGGAESEYWNYLHRRFPPRMWMFEPADHARCFAGFSAVGKKNGRQRK